MLATVLKGEAAERQSIFIMRAFREMRRFIASNALLFEKVSHIELKQLEYQKSTDEKFDKVFRYIEDHAESEQKIFFDGQIYDAFSLSIRCICIKKPMRNWGTSIMRSPKRMGQASLTQGSGILI
uniref:hypothetical protein n=1 Tax=Eubacterium cellulosolvens TaxID=29322 RepID=UPI000484D2D7|nr:hypothetical protein [[Eubacterium] cellulosolvens]